MPEETDSALETQTETSLIQPNRVAEAVVATLITTAIITGVQLGVAVAVTKIRERKAKKAEETNE